MSKEKYIFLSSPVMRSPQIFGLPDESLHLDFITVQTRIYWAKYWSDCSYSMTCRIGKTFKTGLRYQTEVIFTIYTFSTFSVSIDNGQRMASTLRLWLS
jgi:hypothetical protein